MAIFRSYRLSLLLISFFLSAGTAFGQARPLSELTAGEYPKLVNVLGPISYRPETLQKLAHPTLIYADLEWFKEKKFAVPNKLTPQFEKQLLDILAFAKQIKGEPADAYTNQTTVAHSEFYGGDEAGMNGNLGSGRASSMGEIQTKGVGPTSMVNRAKTDEEHSTGTMGLYEGLMEVLGSQIAHNELPYGANRIIALIATGTKTKSGEERVLSVREDPLRPAHFIINETKANLVREKNRMKYVMSKITDVLPLPAGALPRSQDERLKLGVLEVIRRHAHVAAYSYANHFLHSAFSPSNETMEGGALDFGAFMALRGYPRAGRLDDNELNGDLNSVEFVVEQFIKSLRQELPKAMVKNVPTVRDAIEILKDNFNSQLRSEMIDMTGAPPELTEYLKKSSAYKKLSETLVQMSYVGNEEAQNALGDGVHRTDTYLMEVILQKMASLLNQATDSNARNLMSLFDRELTNDIPDARLRKSLSKQYIDYVYALAQVAKNQGITFVNLRQYIQLKCEVKNRLTKPIIAYDGHTPGIDWGDKIRKFETDGDPTALRRTLKEAIRSSRRTYRDAPPMTVTLREVSYSDGSTHRESFELKTGRIVESLAKPAIVRPAAETSHDCRVMLK